MALKMRAIPFMKACEAHELAIKEWPRPVPKPNEVLIKVKAFGLNFAEIVARKGQYQDAPPFPFVAGYEVSGTIEEIGDQVQGFEKGQKVFAFCDFGGYAEYCAVRQEAVFPLPDILTYSQGASLPVQFATAYHCLHETGQLREGTRVLIHAAAGGVGLAAVQLCRIAGAEIIGTCGSEEKVGILRESGVNHPINYTVSDYSVEVQKLFPDGVDVILNSLGGDTIKKDLALLRAGGRVVGYGGADLTDRSFFKAFSLIPKVLSMLTLNSIDLLMNSRSFCGVNMKRVGDQRPDLLRLDMLAVVKLLEEGKLKTIISQELPWDKLGHAQGLMENRKTTGKIVLVIPDEEEAAAAAPVEDVKGKADQEESGPSSQSEEASE